jgi:hypothetical protein
MQFNLYLRMNISSVYGRNKLGCAVARGWTGGPDHDQQHCYHYVPTVNQKLLLQLLSS